MNADRMATIHLAFSKMKQVQQAYKMLASAYISCVERSVSYITDVGTSGSKYSENQFSIMDSHISLAESHMSRIINQTKEVVEKINGIQKRRLNLIKIEDPLVRYTSMTELSMGTIGGILLMFNNPMSQFIGILSTIISSIAGAMSSGRGLHLEEALQQKMLDFNDQVSALSENKDYGFKSEYPILHKPVLIVIL